MRDALLEIYRTSLKPSDTVFNVYLARPLATPIVALGERYRWHPNLVSWMGLLFMVLGSLVFSIPAFFPAVPLDNWTFIVAGVTAVELSYLCDCADGQLARRLKLASKMGAELDFLVDELKAYLLLVGLTLNWWGTTPSESAPLLWGLAGMLSLGVALASTRFIRNPVVQASGAFQTSRHGESAQTRHQKKPFWWIWAIARLITQYPQSLPIFALLNLLPWFVMVYTVLHLGYSLLRLAQMLRNTLIDTE